jgi:hypothetical protein
LLAIGLICWPESCNHLVIPPKKMWSQIYDPLGNTFLSTLAAVVPIVVLLGGIGLFRLKAHFAALLGLLSSLVIAVLAFRMPPGMAFASAVYGGAFGLLPIGWIVLNVIFLYQLTLEKGSFTILQESIAAITRDRRLQLVFIAFSLGAFFEGAAGFGTPVAVTGAMLIGVGFRPLQASGLSLGSLFSGLLIRLEIGLAAIALAGNGLKISFADSPESHCSWVSGGRMTGIRVCIWATSSFGSPVMITQVRNHSLVRGFCQPSQRPAKTKGESSFISIE